MYEGVTQHINETSKREVRHIGFGVVYQVQGNGKVVTLPPYQTIDSSNQFSKLVHSMTIGFSRVPSSESSGNSSSRKSLLHFCRHASVTVDDVRIQTGGVRDSRGGMGNGRD